MGMPTRFPIQTGTSTRSGAGHWGSASQNPTTNSYVHALMPLSSFSSTLSVDAAACDTSLNIFATYSYAFQLRAGLSLQPWCRHTVRGLITLTFVMLNVGYVYLDCLQEDVF